MQNTDNSVGVPAFLTKLWKMVDDPKTNNLICWGDDGKSFTIRNEVTFWYNLLPLYYKHNNMSSFVRQLNMYGFHKISSLTNDLTDDKNEYQFMHPYFKKDQPHLLKLIKRKVTNSKIVSSNEKVVDNVSNNDQLRKVLSDVKQIHNRQSHVDNVINDLQNENSVVWRELAVLRQKHQKLQQIVNKLIQFLVTIVQPSTRVSGLGMKRQFPLMIKNTPKKRKRSDVQEDRPTIHELGADAEELFNSSEYQMENLASTSQEANELLTDEIDPIPNIEQPLSNQIEDDTNIPVEDLLIDASVPDYINIYDNNLDPSLNQTTKDVLLNPTSGDAILSNVIDDTQSDLRKQSDMTIATLDNHPSLQRLNSLEDMKNHLKTSESELDHLKEVLSGSIDSSTLLSLFTEIPLCDLPLSQSTGGLPEHDFLGSELTPYDSTVDFNELFDDTESDNVAPYVIEANQNQNESINTPEITDIKPLFDLDELNT